MNKCESNPDDSCGVVSVNFNIVSQSETTQPCQVVNLHLVLIYSSTQIHISSTRVSY